jgi:hypothetical protein
MCFVSLHIFRIRPPSPIILPKEQKNTKEQEEFRAKEEPKVVQPGFFVNSLIFHSFFTTAKSTKSILRNPITNNLVSDEYSSWNSIPSLSGLHTLVPEHDERIVCFLLKKPLFI